MTQRLYLAGKGLSEARRITTGGNDESEGRIEAIQFPPANRFKVRSIRWTQAIKREAAIHRCCAPFNASSLLPSLQDYH